ncbi:Poly polymerase [Eumeta japonica]|uniref:NAD(+) ADP-ribosyltransferase n=1 Tax=Eumeta variegata TaxID=151549 RepID=A0A4C1V1X6_EUMVA|nr:Poly polymerase [Eumeta japonica]
MKRLMDVSEAGEICKDRTICESMALPALLENKNELTLLFIILSILVNPANLSSDVVMPNEKKGKGKGTKRANSDNNAALKDFAIEYSKSSRATCKVCDIKICKGEVRISKVAYDTEVAKKFGGQSLWHHVNCFAEARSELLYFAGGENLPGFKVLKKEDQKMVKETIKPMKSDEIPVKKPKIELKNEEEIKEEKELEKKIEEQNKLFQMHRKTLTGYSAFVIDKVLLDNAQNVSSGYDEKINHLADCMAFGALEPCPNCTNGQYVLENYGYRCTGSISEWTKCQNITQTPKRKPLEIKEELKNSKHFLDYQPKVGIRIFTATKPPKQTIVKKEESGESSQKAQHIPPLKNLQFFIQGKVSNKEEVKKRIIKLGGLVVNKLNDAIAAVVSTKADVEKIIGKMKSIQEQQIEVIEESFFDLIDKEKGSVGDSLELIKENNIAAWGSDPKTRVPQDIVDGKSLPKSGGIYLKSSKSGVQKLKVKGGTLVDPDSGLADVAHVYIDQNGEKWTVVLNKTDIGEEKNSFYKLQLLEDDVIKKSNDFPSLADGSYTGKWPTCPIDALEGTGSFHPGAERERKSAERRFSPVQAYTMLEDPAGYYPVDMDYGDNQDNDDRGASKTLTVDSNSKLHISVQQLMCSIFDIQLMKRTLLEFEWGFEMTYHQRLFPMNFDKDVFKKRTYLFLKGWQLIRDSYEVAGAQGRL